jgi:hypothetical protein
MLNGMGPQLLTPGLFSQISSTIASTGSRAFNFISALGTPAAAGLSVGAGAGVLLSRALSVMGCGSVCRPDIISTAGGQTTVLDNKFRWESGKDEFSKAQKRNYKQIDKNKKLRPVTGKQCGCP